MNFFERHICLLILFLVCTINAQNAIAQNAPVNISNPPATTNTTQISGQSVTSIANQQKSASQIKSILNGQPTYSGLPTFKKGIKVQGNSNGVHDITFHDGSTQDSAAINTVYVSTFGVFSLANTAGVLSMPTCLANSTYTFTLTANSTLTIDLSLTFDTINSNVDGGNLLIDGSYVDTFSASHFMVNYQNNTANHIFTTISLSHYTTVKSYASGTHSACVTVAVGGATEHLNCGTGACYYHVGQSL